MMLVEGAHIRWLGATDSRDRPILHAKGKPYQVARVAWTAHWGLAPSDMPYRRHLRRVCPLPGCVRPVHWPLAHGRAVCKALGYGLRDTRRMVATVRSKSLTAAPAGLWHDLALVEREDFGMPVAMLEALAHSLGVPRLAILAAWSILLTGGKPWA